MNKQIKLGAMISYASLAINTIASVIYLPWMVSIIGKEDYALYTLATTLISLFLMDFGLSSAVSRFITKYNAEHEEEKINKFVSTVEALYLIIGGVVFISLMVIYFFIDEIYVGLSAAEIGKYKQLFLIVLIYSVISFPCMPFSGILNAYERFIESKICDLVQKMCAIFLTVTFLLCGGGVREVVIANVISGILVVIFKIILIKRKTPIVVSLKSWDKTIIKEIFSFSIWITVISLAQRCIYNLAPTILGIVSNSDAIAMFAPANTLESFYFMIASAVNSLFLPTVSRFISERNENKIFNLMLRVGRYQLILLGYVFIVFLCVGKEFIIGWMGEDFLLAYPCTLLLFLPDIFLFTQQIADTVAIAKNMVKLQSFGYIGMAIVCMILSFVLCGKFGVVGSAIAIATSYFVLFVYLNRLYHKHLHINVFLFFRNCYFKMGLPIIFVGVVTYFLCSIVNIDNIWISIIIKGIIATVVYVPTVYIKLDEAEKGYVKRVINKIMRKERVI